MALPEGTLLKKGRYRIQKLLAYGGCGFTYLAHDQLTEQQVVLKELIPALAEHRQAVRRFVREGRTMQRLRHPNLVRTEATFRDGGNHYIVLEYVAGLALSDWTERGQKMSLERASTLILSLCDVVSYLHQRGVIHNDLTPSNVFLDTGGQPRLGDLGIAHVSDALVHRSWRTERDFVMGTMFYMAPEQLDGLRADPRVDLYAIAAIFYQLLSGRHYLDFNLRHTPGAQAENIRRVQNERPRSIPGVPPEVMSVIRRGLAKNVSLRYPDVSTFRHALIQALIAYLPARKSMRLLAPFGADGQEPPSLETIEWPSWIWGALLAVNVAVMLLVGLLLMRSPAI
jgi:serine/threonine-protein kinase